MEIIFRSWHELGDSEARYKNIITTFSVLYKVHPSNGVKTFQKVVALGIVEYLSI